MRRAILLSAAILSAALLGGCDPTEPAAKAIWQISYPGEPIPPLVDLPQSEPYSGYWYEREGKWYPVDVQAYPTNQGWRVPRRD
jgi:hypothetical protein